MNQTALYIRRAFANSPSLGMDTRTTVINIESYNHVGSDTGHVTVDLDDGTSISINFERFTRDVHDEATVQQVVASKARELAVLCDD